MELPKPKPKARIYISGDIKPDAATGKILTRKSNQSPQKIVRLFS